MGITSSVNDSVNPAQLNHRAQPKTGNGSSSQELQDSFLTLLIAQMQNQDPTNPMDNSQLTSQLAQISTLSGIEKLNTTLGSISGQIDNGAAMQAGNLIGHGVMVPGDTILASTIRPEAPPAEPYQTGESGEVEGGGETGEQGPVGELVTTPFGIELDRGADQVVVTIKDASGNVVRQVDLGAMPAGVSSFTWDGQLDDGTTAKDGSYTFSVQASNGGQPVVVTSLAFAQVYGVVKNQGNVLLDLGLAGSVSMDEIRQIF